MTKKTKEAIKATAAIIIVLVALFLLWIYPLNQAGKIVSRPDQETPMPDPAEFGLAYDTLSFVTEDNLVLAGMALSAAPKEGDSGSAPETPKGMVILIHGLFDGSYSQLEKAAALAEAGFRVIIYDQRAFGKSEGKYRSGGYYGGNDLQELLYRLNLEDRIVRPLLVWGEDQGGTAALKAWENDDSQIDYVIAENPIVNGRDWQKRVRKHDNRSAPDIMLGIIWWWMKQKTGYEMSVSNSDISDAFGTAIVDRPEKLLMITCGAGETPDNDYIAELKEMGGEWLILPCDSTSNLFEKNKDTIMPALTGLIR